MVLFSIGLVLFAIVGCIGGWIAIFKLRGLAAEVDRLRSAVLRLEAGQVARGEDLGAAAPAVAAAPRDTAVASAAPPSPSPAPAAPTMTASDEAASDDKAGEDVFRALATQFERLFVANWLVWLGAGALALGGLFLVRYAVEQGYFGPALRTGAAFLAGFAIVAAGEWLRRRAHLEGASGQIPRVPLAVAAAGLVTLYGASYAAGPLYGLVPPLVTLALYVAVCAGALLLSLLHGSVLAILGLLGAYLAPVVAGGSGPAPFLLLGYAFAVTLAALLLVFTQGWRHLVWVALAGAGFWGTVALGWLGLSAGPLALVLYVGLLVAASTWLAWTAAEPPLPVPFPRRSGEAEAPGQTIYAAYGFWVLGATLFALSVVERDHETLLVAASGVFSLAALAAAWRRESFALLAALGAASVLWTVATWPETSGAPGIAERPAPRTAELLRFAGPMGALFGFGGWFALGRLRGKLVMAIASAALPLLVLILIFFKLEAHRESIAYGLTGIALALAALSAVEALAHRPGGLDAVPGTASAYVLGGVGALTFAIMATLDAMWMTALLAAQIPVVALLDRRFGLRALCWYASGLAALVTARIVWPPEILGYAVSARPILNELLIVYGVPIAAFWAAGRLFRRADDGERRRLAEALEVSAILIGGLYLSVEIRHIAGNGNLAGPFRGLAEVSAHCLAWIAMAVGLALRLGQTPPRLMRWAEMAVFAIATSIAGLGLLLFWNPVLRAHGDPVWGPPVVGLLFLAYALPAAFFAAYSVVKRRKGAVAVSHVAGFTGLALAFLYTTLEVRRAFRGPYLASGTASDGETYAYSIAWILFAVATLVVGLARRRVVIRHAAMAVLVLAIVKVFVFDMSALQGILRAVSFLGLGAALLGIAMLYQRAVFWRDETAAEGTSPS